MKATVTKAVSDRPVDKDGLVDWANRELIPMLAQMRTGINASITERQEGMTDGVGTFLQVWVSEEMPTDAAWAISASVAAVSADGGGKRAGYLLKALGSSVGGTVALDGLTVLWDFETDAACDATLVVDGRRIVLQVRDDGVSAMRFASRVDITEIRR
jgi:hypothetical protein